MVPGPMNQPGPCFILSPTDCPFLKIEVARALGICFHRAHPLNKPTLRQKPPAPSGRKWIGRGLTSVVITAGLVTYARSRRSPASSGPADARPKSTKTAIDSPFAPTIPNRTPAPGPAPGGMVWIPGGEFSMGSDATSESLCGLPGVSRDALPIHRVYVDGFWMDATEVTNEEFEKFVKATGYVPVAEQKPTQEEFPAAPPENLVAGSTAFTPTPQPVSVRNFYQWWAYVAGA